MRAGFYAGFAGSLAPEGLNPAAASMLAKFAPPLALAKVPFDARRGPSYCNHMSGQMDEDPSQERRRKEVELVMLEVEDLARRIARAWKSPKTATRLVEEQRR